MINYKYALVDAQWLLTRNFCAMGGRNNAKVDEGFPYRLAASVTSSILTTLSSFSVEKIILVWDTPPYHKQSLLNSTYKGTRYYMTQEQAEEMEDGEEKEKALIDAHNFKKRSEAKAMLKNLACIGLPSIWRTGYEADDLVYLLAQEIYTRGENALIVSIDSDWEYWTAPGVDWFNPKSDLVTTHEAARSGNRVEPDMTLFRFKTLYDSFYGSHNDLVQTVKAEVYDRDCLETFKEFNRLGYSEELFDDVNLARTQIMSFDFQSYPDYQYLRVLMESIDSIGSVPTFGQLAEISNKMAIDFNTNNFQHYYKTLNRKLFQE